MYAKYQKTNLKNVCKVSKNRSNLKNNQNTFLKVRFFFLFYLYIYPPDSQESDGALIHRVGNYPTCFQRCQDIAVRL